MGRRREGEWVEGGRVSGWEEGKWVGRRREGEWVGEWVDEWEGGWVGGGRMDG